MYAIVDIAGQQFKVEKDQKIYVNRLEAEEGSKIDFEKILLIDDNGKIKVGTPVVKNMIVTASVVSHLKGDKVKVFKKKRRKGYRVLNGHRQALTQLLIEGIGEGQVRTKVTPKKEAQQKAEIAEKPKTQIIPEKKPVEAKKAVVKKAPIKKASDTTAKRPKSEISKPVAKAKATTTKKTEKPAAKTTAKKETKTVKKATTKAKTITKTGTRRASKSKKENK